MSTAQQQQQKSQYPHCMNRLAVHASHHKKNAFFWLLFFLALAIAGIVFGGWITGLATTLIFYAVFNFVIFSIVRPQDWEASILFLAFILAAAVFILMFGGIYHVNQLALAGLCEKQDSGLNCKGAQALDWYYYSTAVFTTLGFGDILPTTPAGKITTSIEALIGMAFGVTAIVIFLGRNAWFSTKGGSDADKAPTNPTHQLTTTDLQPILQLLASQAREIEALKQQLTEHTKQTALLSKKIEKLYRTSGLAALIALLLLVGVATFFKAIGSAA